MSKSAAGRTSAQEMGCASDGSFLVSSGLTRSSVRDIRQVSRKWTSGSPHSKDRHGYRRCPSVSSAFRVNCLACGEHVKYCIDMQESRQRRRPWSRHSCAPLGLLAIRESERLFRRHLCVIDGLPMPIPGEKWSRNCLSPAYNPRLGKSPAMRRKRNQPRPIWPSDHGDFELSGVDEG